MRFVRIWRRLWGATAAPNCAEWPRKTWILLDGTLRTTSVWLGTCCCQSALSAAETSGIHDNSVHQREKRIGGQCRSCWQLRRIQGVTDQTRAPEEQSSRVGSQEWSARTPRSTPTCRAPQKRRGSLLSSEPLFHDYGSERSGGWWSRLLIPTTRHSERADSCTTWSLLAGGSAWLP